MQEDGYLAHLRARLTLESSRSYISNLRRVERDLHTDVDALDLSVSGIDNLVHRLRSHGLAGPSVSNCRSALAAYAAFKVGTTTSGGSRPPARSPAPTMLSAGEQMPAIDALSIPRLMQLYARILSELRDRKVTRTANGPVGDYAEMLFQQALGWQLAPNSRAGYDATDLAGTRYQIKARRLMTSAASRQLGAIRRLPERDFDVLAAILFDADVAVMRAVLIPHAVVVEQAKWSAHTNSWRLMLSDKFCLHPEIVDVSTTIKLIAST